MSMHRALFELIKTVPIDGNRIYLLRAPQNSPAPFVIYQQTSSERWRDVNGPSGMVQASVQIDVYASTANAARDLHAQVEAVLDGFRGTVSYGTDSPRDSIRFAGISCQNDVDIFDQTDEPFLYRVSADYLITYEQS